MTKEHFIFFCELDKLKSVLRQSPILDGQRRENSAEHSWHVTTMAMILAEYSLEEFNIQKIMSMLLVHDIVEIDAGDTFVYDIEARQQKAELEAKAAERIFGLLPTDQGKYYRQLWLEYENGESPEAHFARGLDRLQPIIQNYINGGGSWRVHGITKGQVLERNSGLQYTSPEIYNFFLELLEDAEKKGYFKKEQ